MNTFICKLFITDVSGIKGPSLVFLSPSWFHFSLEPISCNYGTEYEEPLSQQSVEGDLLTFIFSSEPQVLYNVILPKEDILPNSHQTALQINQDCTVFWFSHPIHVFSDQLMVQFMTLFCLFLPQLCLVSFIWNTQGLHTVTSTLLHLPVLPGLPLKSWWKPSWPPTLTFCLTAKPGSPWWYWNLLPIWAMVSLVDQR